MDERAAADWNESEREAILAELNSIVADPVFKRSLRCVALLRSMVDHALCGDQDGVKERTLGVEVFGRSADYDSSTDPVVRMTANEIRKRLAQYYQDPGRRQRVTIRLTPGRYIPEFDLQPPESTPLQPASSVPVEAPEAEAAPTYTAAAEPVSHAPARIQPAQRLSLPWLLPAGLLMLVLLVVFAVSSLGLFRSTQVLVWKPLMQSQTPLVLCVADNTTLEERGHGQLSAAERKEELQRLADMINTRKVPAIADPANFDPTTPFVDVSVAHEITTWLEQHGRSSYLRASSVLSLQDFHHRSLVLVGGFDNPWNAILLSDMRFSLRVDPASGSLWIRDTQNSAARPWMRHVLDGGEAAVDYAVITRFRDTETDNWILSIAGLGPHGTEAAGQLLIDPEFAGALPSAIRSAGNFQLIVRTNLVNGITGPPHVEAFYRW